MQKSRRPINLHQTTGPHHEFRLFRHYPGQVLGHQCVIKDCRSGSKCRIRFTNLAPKVSLIFTIIFIIGAFDNNIFHTPKELR